ncbi:ADP compounds hydrolase nudE [Candidatus Photodesmus katoptron]|uniref:ADP compounds hydrolase NudE n=1 Tax=Candidatus Photodesmus katoptron Akat1 TaxID=1236703 RepID=S3DGG3_9GAMM|nr:ADP compounds hydrolase NudE [Candidatus Photodesmus katoptron]EPE37537.1 ADP compounds hydrolase NudE [Candidatus Photodesmus katoptron Akat1]KEY90187.1 ADP compounds hydrolase nudE [Candidatus Photodesmus katoptron]
MKKKSLPEILEKKIISQSKLFSIESIKLVFGNGEKRTYERMKPRTVDAVMIVPIMNGNFLLVQEYAVGTERYELSFPKGLVDLGESQEEAAIRELKEEIGFGSNCLIFLKEVVLAPSYFSGRMIIFIGKDLYPERLKGDEPEPLEVIPWSIRRSEELITHINFCESRSLAALLLSLRYLEKNAIC